MESSLVSLIVPCYNGEKTIARLLDSVLAQTYEKIEVIVVNDGSKDRSEEIIRSYEKHFLETGRKLICVNQENRGLGGAIDTALKHFHGDYLCFADADDFLAPESISHRIHFLQEHPEFGAVSSDAYRVSEKDPSKPISRISAGFTQNADENQFWHLLNADSIFCTGCHMIRAEAFLKVNPERSIYPARRGQNWQLLLPVYYRYKRGYLDEPLYYYVTAPNTMSDDGNDAIRKLFRCDEHEEILANTLCRIPLTEADREKAEHIVAVNYARRRLRIAAHFGKKDIAAEQYQKLKQMKSNTVKDLLCLRTIGRPRLRKLLHMS